MSSPTMLQILIDWKKWRYISGSSENTIYAQGKYAEKFIRSIRANRADKVTPEMVHAFVNDRDDKSFNTKSFALSSIRAFFAYAKGKGYCSINPTDIVKVNKRILSHKQREGRTILPFTEEEVNVVLDVAPYFLRQATALSWFTGLRLGDICGLEWDSITDDHIIVWTDKRDKRVALPLDHIAIGGGQVRKYIDEIEKVNSILCFPTQNALNSCTNTRSRTSDSFTKLVRSKGINDKSFHCLRHSFVTRLSNMGMDLTDIGKYVGHSNTQTTEGYNHV